MVDPFHGRAYPPSTLVPDVTLALPAGLEKFGTVHDPRAQRRDDVNATHRLKRRSLLLGAGAATIGIAARPGLLFAQQATPMASPVAGSPPLWQTAWERGIVYGTSLATWQADDAEYVPLVDREAAILFTEDDLLWWRLKPTPDAELDFQYGDRFVELAESQGQLVIGAHLVWDEGFGEGWTEEDIWGLETEAARSLLFGTLEQMVGRYKGRVAGWITVNEAIDAHEEDGLRRDFPWYETVGPTYIEEAFRLANETDPDALLILNEFGFETDDEFDAAADKRAKALTVIDALLDADVPVHALGVQAHLVAGGFAEAFDPEGYQTFLAEVAGRGLEILVTEMDVIDDGLPADVAERDAAIADVYRLYLETALAEPALRTVITFGLTDRYT